MRNYFRMRSEQYKGITAILCAVGCFSLMDACMKHLTVTFAPMQVAFLRSAASMPCILLMTALTGQWRELRPVRYGIHALRGAVSVFTLWFFVYAVSVLSLADAYSIFLSAPLLITALSVPLLKEHVGWHRWAAVVVGLLGVLLILKPGSARVVTLGGVAALLSAGGYALSVLLIRMLGRTDTAAATMFWQLAAAALLSGAFAMANWVRIESSHWQWIAAIGITGALGQYFITQAFRRAAAATIAPFEYTCLVYGMALDWLLWSTLPTLRMLTGAAIVIASGMYVIWREKKVT